MKDSNVEYGKITFADGVKDSLNRMKTIEGFDSCPMEGMDENRIKKLFKLPKEGAVCMALRIGVRAKDGGGESSGRGFRWT